MFRNAINDTPFLGTLPDSVFSRVCGQAFRGDYSFISTLRALVFPRMPEEDGISFSYKEIALSKADVERNHKDVIMQHILSVRRGGYMMAGTIQLYNTCNSNSESNKATLDAVEKNFPGFVGGNFVKVERLTEYYKKIFRVLCYINQETKTTVVFTDNIDLRRFHLLQVAIPVMLPWYFPPEAGVTDQEKAILESFNEKTPDSYMAALNAAAEKYDFRTMKIKNELGNFENRFLEREAQNARNNLDQYLSAVRELEDMIASKMKLYYDEDIRLAGIQAKIAAGDGTSEIVSYFIRNRNLSLISVERNRLIFECKGYLSYFDEEGVKRNLNNRNSVVYYASDRIPVDDIEMLMKAIFLDQKLRMKFCASYIFDLSGYVRANSHATYGSEFNDCMPNPHIDEYSCLGNYERVINEYLRKHDYVGAIEQCISSCMSLNFADSTVISEFMRRISGSSSSRVNSRCIELPDGSVVSPREAIQWLKDQNEQKKAKEAAAETAGEGTNE